MIPAFASVGSLALVRPERVPSALEALIILAQLNAGLLSR